MPKPTRAAHHRTLSGPDLTSPFFVASGMIAVVGLKHTITLPTGATWPGLEALGQELGEDLQPGETVASPGAETRVATEGDILAGLALVQAQLLRAGPITAQLVRLDRHEIGPISQQTKAAFFGVTREAVAKLDVQRPHARPPLPPSEVIR